MEIKVLSAKQAQKNIKTPKTTIPAGYYIVNSNGDFAKFKSGLLAYPTKWAAEAAVAMGLIDGWKSL